VCVLVLKGSANSQYCYCCDHCYSCWFLQSKEISQDQSKNTSTDIQKVTDKYVKMIDDVVTAKEKEIMTI
jgi:Ribosome recycling factor